MDDREQIIGIDLIAWLVLGGNLILLIGNYFIPSVGGSHLHPLLVKIAAVPAAFPLSFYYTYFPEDWYAHFGWIATMMLTALGLMRRSRMARTIFMVLNVIHLMIIFNTLMLHWSRPDFLEHFFQLYFNGAVSGAYIGFLTLTEVRAWFHVTDTPLSTWWKRWWMRRRLRPPTAQDAYGFYNLGVAYNRLERNEEAVEALKRSVEIDPGKAEFHFSLGEAYVKVGKDHDAVKAFRKALKLDPIHPAAAFELGQTYQRQGCFREAMDAFSQATHVRPNHAEAHLGLGRALLESGHVPEALEALKKAGDLNPQSAEIALLVGEIYFNKTEDTQGAREALRRAVRIDPHSARAHALLGRISLKLNRPKDAVRHLKEAVRLDANDPQAHYELGRAYVFLKDLDSARRQEKILKDLDPDLAKDLSLLIQ